MRHWDVLKFFFRKIKCNDLWHTTHLLSKFFPSPEETPAGVEAKLLASPEEQGGICMQHEQVTPTQEDLMFRMKINGILFSGYSL